jgi:hypothetical protein
MHQIVDLLDNLACLLKGSLQSLETLENVAFHLLIELIVSFAFPGLVEFVLSAPELLDHFGDAVGLSMKFRGDCLELIIFHKEKFWHVYFSFRGGACVQKSA